MNLKDNKVIITGGSNGIGLGLAEIFSRAGSSVIICARRKEKLDAAAEKLPGIKIKECDISVESEREDFYRWAAEVHPDTNILINNAGIQERVSILDEDFWEKSVSEISTNLKAPLHLTSLFIPLLKKNKNPAVVNVTSGLAFVPMAFAPVYCATKAALRSFTQTLRVQLADSVEVVEIIPPAVNTDLGGPGMHTFGVPLHEFIAAVEKGILEGKNEIAFGTSMNLYQVGRKEFNEAFQRMNNR